MVVKQILNPFGSGSAGFPIFPILFIALLIFLAYKGDKVIEFLNMGNFPKFEKDDENKN